jgi:uncharacterized protein YrzB (UPF0473 family)
MSDLENNIPEEDEEEVSILTLTDENGQEVSYEFLDLISYKGQDYIILLPIEEDDSDDGLVVILEVHEIDEENEEYVSIEDEAVLDAVYDIFKEKYKEFFNFTD